MKRIELVILLFGLHIGSVCAETSTPTPPSTPVPQQIAIVLKNRSNNPLRAPAFNKIVGTYDEDGMFTIDLYEDSIWEMTIEGIGGETGTYFVSTLELQQGVYIGVMSGFGITITNNSSITYIGEIYL